MLQRRSKAQNSSYRRVIKRIVAHAPHQIDRILMSRLLIDLYLGSVLYRFRLFSLRVLDMSEGLSKGQGKHIHVFPITLCPCRMRSRASPSASSSPRLFSSDARRVFRWNHERDMHQVVELSLRCSKLLLGGRAIR